jgi:hypothetical protein
VYFLNEGNYPCIPVYYHGNYPCISVYHGNIIVWLIIICLFIYEYSGIDRDCILSTQRDNFNCSLLLVTSY